MEEVERFKEYIKNSAQGVAIVSNQVFLMYSDGRVVKTPYENGYEVDKSRVISDTELLDFCQCNKGIIEGLITATEEQRLGKAM